MRREEGMEGNEEPGVCPTTAIRLQYIVKMRF